MDIVRKEFFVNAADGGHDIYGCVWLLSGLRTYKGIVQISHGMSEHILRYTDFAIFLVKRGYIVCGNDHRGHGRSVETDNDLGFFGSEEDGLMNCVADLKTVQKTVTEYYPNLPIFLLGHSMGSFIARELMADANENFKGVILMGTSGGNSLIDFAINLSRREIEAKGSMVRGISINKLAFSSFNKKCRKKRTSYDWLSKDTDQVDKFMADNKCGFLFTYEGYRDLFLMLRRVSEKGWAERIQKSLPILIISGTEDPVGSYGRGVKKVYKSLCKSGCYYTEMMLIEGDRHELLNERNKGQVYSILYDWIEKYNK